MADDKILTLKETQEAGAKAQKAFKEKIAKANSGKKEEKKD